MSLFNVANFWLRIYRLYTRLNFNGPELEHVVCFNSSNGKLIFFNRCYKVFNIIKTDLESRNIANKLQYKHHRTEFLKLYD